MERFLRYLSITHSASAWHQILKTALTKPSFTICFQYVACSKGLLTLIGFYMSGIIRHILKENDMFSTVGYLLIVSNHQCLLTVSFAQKRLECHQ